MNNPNQSKEKILHLKKGYFVWKGVCRLFGISLVVFIISIVISIVVSPFLFVITGLAGLGFFACLVFACCCQSGFITIAPNEAEVYHYYGRYLGTVKDNGYFYGYPLAKTFRISLILIKLLMDY